MFKIVIYKVLEKTEIIKQIEMALHQTVTNPVFSHLRLFDKFSIQTFEKEIVFKNVSLIYT